MKHNYKEKILLNPQKIYEILDGINKVKKSLNCAQVEEIKSIEKKIYAILSKKSMVKWNQRLRQKKINEYKVKKKGIILKIK